MWHNYGKSTIGAKVGHRECADRRLQAFYKKYYQPDNAALMVAGKFDEAKTLALIQENFGKIARPARKLDVTYTAEPVQDGERTVTVKRVGDVQLVIAAYKIPDGAHPDMAALDLLSDVLADAPAGRLHKALVEVKKATGTMGGIWLLGARCHVLWRDGAKGRQSDDVKRIVAARGARCHKKPPTKEEVERARQSGPQADRSCFE